MNELFLTSDRKLPLKLSDGLPLDVTIEYSPGRLAVNINGVEMEGATRATFSVVNGKPTLFIARTAEPFNTFTRQESEIMFIRLERVLVKAKVIA